MRAWQATRLGSVILLFVWAAGAADSSTEPPVVLGNHTISHLLGMKVEDLDGQKLGTLNDFVVDLNAGEIKYALVSPTSLIARRKIVPADLISMATAKRKTLALDVPKFRWKRAPSFKNSDLSALTQSANAQVIYQFYALTPGEPKMTVRTRPQFPLTPTGRQPRRPGAHELKLQLASDIIGTSVTTAQNKSIGQISDLLIDFSGKRPAFVVLTIKRFLRHDLTYALPLHRLTLTAGNSFSLNANPAQLEQAPPLTQQEWKLAGAEPGKIYRYEIK